MVIAAGDQRCPRRRAERRRVKLRIPQSRVGNAIHAWGRDDTAEGAGHAIALIIGHDQQHVWRAFGWYYRGWPIRLGILGSLVDYAAKLGRLGGKLTALDRCRGGRRTRRARDLLSHRVVRKR